MHGYKACVVLLVIEHIKHSYTYTYTHIHTYIQILCTQTAVPILFKVVGQRYMITLPYSMHAFYY